MYDKSEVLMVLITVLGILTFFLGLFWVVDQADNRAANKVTVCIEQGNPPAECQLLVK